MRRWELRHKSNTSFEVLLNGRVVQAYEFTPEDGIAPSIVIAFDMISNACTVGDDVCFPADMLEYIHTGV